MPEVRAATWAEALLTFVQRYPGVHLREIRRRLGIPIGTLDYHLYRLFPASRPALRRGERSGAFLAQSGDGPSRGDADGVADGRVV